MLEWFQELDREDLLAVKPRQPQRGRYASEARHGLLESQGRLATNLEAAPERRSTDRGTLASLGLPERAAPRVVSDGVAR